MDSERVPGANLELVRSRMITAIRKVRQIELFKRAPLLAIPEAAPGPIARVADVVCR